MAPATLCYWNIRGYAQPIRLLLAHVGADYEDKRFTLGPDMDRTEWLNEKFSLGLDFPNLPYYIEGDVKLSQTFAILKYLGRKHDLQPRSEIECQRLDLIEAEALDMRMKWTLLCYSPEFDDKKPEFLKNLATKLKEVSEFLGNHQYFVGDHITYIDFVMYELLDQHSLLEPSALKDFKNLQEFHTRIQSLSKVSAYIKSEQFIPYPLNAPVAKFGGK